MTYVQGLGIDSKIARIDHNGGAGEITLFYVGDAMGSVSHLTTNAGVVTDTCVSNAFGEEIAKNIVNTERYSFQQREKDESGLLHFRARFYDPRTGRFGGKDRAPG